MNDLATIKKCAMETPNIAHGRLLEAVHFSGYGMDRVFKKLNWLLDEDRWKTVGDGFEDIDDYLKTIDLSEHKIPLEDRQAFARRLTDIRASQRAIAKALGVGKTTVQKDLIDGPKGPKPEIEVQQKQDVSDDVGPKGPKPDILALKHTGNQENYTPQKVIDLVKTVLGNIDLDPASCDFAQEIIQAVKYFTEEEDGLSKAWHGNVFLNPPYQMPQIREFTDKLIEELPNIKSAILLTNNNTDTLWFYKCARHAKLICFTKGRINFYKTDKEETQPTNGQAFFYFGEDEGKFIEVFSETGLIMKKVKNGQ